MELTGPQSGVQSTDQILLWIEDLRQEHKARPKRWLKKGLISVLLISILIAGTDLFAHAVQWSWLIHHPAIMASLAGFPMMTYIICPSKRELNAARGLATCNLVGKDAANIAPVLLEAMTTFHVGIEASAMAALIRVLPEVQPGDVHLFEKRHRDQMREALKGCIGIGCRADRKAEYAVELLRVVALLEDTSFCSLVERLAAASGDDEKRTMIRVAASECHDKLRLVMSQQNQGKCLLRATTESESNGILLRGAKDIGADSADLLRPITASDLNTDTIEQQAHN